jgi:hypothetical protein
MNLDIIKQAAEKVTPPWLQPQQPAPQQPPNQQPTQRPQGGENMTKDLAQTGWANDYIDNPDLKFNPATYNIPQRYALRTDPNTGKNIPFSPEEQAKWKQDIANWEAMRDADYRRLGIPLTPENEHLRRHGKFWAQYELEQADAKDKAFHWYQPSTWLNGDNVQMEAARPAGNDPARRMLASGRMKGYSGEAAKEQFVSDAGRLAAAKVSPYFMPEMIEEVRNGGDTQAALQYGGVAGINDDMLRSMIEMNPNITPDELRDFATNFGYWSDNKALRFGQDLLREGAFRGSAINLATAGLGQGIQAARAGHAAAATANAARATGAAATAANAAEKTGRIARLLQAAKAGDTAAINALSKMPGLVKYPGTAVYQTGKGLVTGIPTGMTAFGIGFGTSEAGYQARHADNPDWAIFMNMQKGKDNYNAYRAMYGEDMANAIYKEIDKPDYIFTDQETGLPMLDASGKPMWEDPRFYSDFVRYAAENKLIDPSVTDRNNDAYIGNVMNYQDVDLSQNAATKALYDPAVHKQYIMSVIRDGVPRPDILATPMFLGLPGKDQAELFNYALQQRTKDINPTLVSLYDKMTGKTNTDMLLQAMTHDRSGSLNEMFYNFFGYGSNEAVDEFMANLNPAGLGGGSGQDRTPLIDAFERGITKRLEYDPTTMLPTMKALTRFQTMKQPNGDSMPVDNSEAANRIRRVFGNAMANPEIVGEMSDQDVLELAEMVSYAENGGSGPILDDNGNDMGPQIKNTIKDRLMEGWRNHATDPEYARRVAALYLNSQGLSGLSEAAQNPWTFYTGAAALLGGGALLMNSGLDEDSDEEPEEEDEDSYEAALHRQPFV